ncbi:DNA-directed RNA polymerase subunit omega [Changpingibacter yushuensis]|uniref:DNA-directed RNA polymerase subunit omega n=1 Tax=Changpingibacter yushuensis TaxID=2758440 RepID=UPI0015F60F31|nr:DNA-directed RNA polymerase subunit omega [Changpingibacter yushuensis]
MFGTVPEPEGITNPPIDDLLEHVDSKYALAVYGAKRARQINSYRQEMKRGDGNITHFGPLVEAGPEDKPLSIALEEIAAGKIEWGSPAE